MSSSEETSRKRIKVVQNEHGGLCAVGHRYGTSKRLEVLSKYFEILEEKGRVVSRSLAAAAHVGQSFALQFIKDLQAGKPVLDGGIAKRDTHVGMRRLDEGDEKLLLQLRHENHQYPLYKYQSELFQRRGTYVSQSTIHRWFLHRYPFRGKLKVGNTFPIDKYTVDNIIRTDEYKQVFSQLDPINTKFGDEAHVKESNCYSNYARVDPITGWLEPILGLFFLFFNLEQLPRLLTGLGLIQKNPL